MGRARGANMIVSGAFETAPGTTPGSGFFNLPLASHTLGEEIPLIDEELLGLGREVADPVQDVKTNVGGVVVPVDARNFWYWLRLFLGAPTTTGTGGAPKVHTFTSGGAALPSMSIEIGHPDVPAFTTNYGARADKLSIALSRRGLLNASVDLICIGETDPVGASVAGTRSTKAVSRFAQAVGSIGFDGQPLASVVEAQLVLSNNLDPVETIKADGRIEDSDPGAFAATGKLTVLYRDTTLLALASAGTPKALTFGWTNGTNSLLFTLPRVFLPKPKRSVSGPKGIQAEYNFKASGAGGNSLTAVLTNDVAAGSY